MWTTEDFEKGWCASEDVGRPKTTHERWTLAELTERALPGYLEGTIKPPSAWCKEPVVAPTEASDEDLLSDLGLARRLYRKDPEGFIARHASVANKLLDIQEKSQSSSGYPSLTDHSAWATLLTKIGKEAIAMDVASLPPPALLLRILYEAGGNLTEFRAVLQAETPKN